MLKVEFGHWSRDRLFQKFALSHHYILRLGQQLALGCFTLPRAGEGEILSYSSQLEVEGTDICRNASCA